MKYILSFFLVFLSLLSNAQNRGYIYYLNQVKASEDVEDFKKNGLNVEILPILVDVRQTPRLDSLLNDYKTYITTWYSQINSITFLDAYQFDENILHKIPKKNSLSVIKS